MTMTPSNTRVPPAPTPDTTEPPGQEPTPPGRATLLRAAAATTGPALALDLLLGTSVATTVAGLLSKPARRRLSGRPRLLAGLGTLAAGAYALALRPWYRRWGATDAEVYRTLPGDDFFPRPRLEITRAVTIHAPAAQVWPWLVQFGQGRGGFYSYDFLENLAGLDIHSVDRVIPELQGLKAGDFIRAAPEGFAPGAGWTVARIEPNHALILCIGPPPAAGGPEAGGAFDGSWAFVLDPIDEQRTRLMFRWRLAGSRLGSAIYVLTTELPHFIMERKMLLGIKQRAEQAVSLTGALPKDAPPATTAQP